jgi:uncharacterized membrane protein
MSRLLGIAITAGAVAWVAMLTVAPLFISRTEGTSIMAAVYGAAGLVCHQRAERSFALAGTQLPVCARCFGLYAAAAAGVMAGCAFGGGWIRAGTRQVRAILALAAAPTAVTVFVEWLELAFPSNIARAAAAVPLGAAAGWIVVRLLFNEAAAGKFPRDAASMQPPTRVHP